MDEFKKSSFSYPVPGANCIYVSLGGGAAFIKSNYNKNILKFTHYEWDAFIKGVKNGEFDLK